MKKYVVLFILSIVLVACGKEEEQVGPKLERLDEVNENVQSLIDFTEDSKFASYIYSETATNYLLLNAAGEVEVELKPEGSDLHIYVTQTDDGTPEEIEDIAYSIYLDQPYDKIHIFEDGQEIPFEVWTE